MGHKKKSKQDTAELGVNEAASILPTSRSRPIFDASGRGPCHAVLTYEACLRLCTNSWAGEARHFLESDCSKLREAFGLNQVLLRSQEQLRKKPSEIASEAAAPKSKKSVGKMIVRVGEVKMQRSSSTAYKEKYDCLFKLKSSSEEDVMSMQPGSSRSYVFLHVDRSDKLIVEVRNSKQQCCGEVLAAVDSVADKPSKKLQLLCQKEHKHVGEIQLLINYSTSQEENNIKCGSIIAETVAYDILLEVAMKASEFRRRKLLLRDFWNWLVNKFESYYGVPDAYAKLRYLSYVMQVATPTEDCLTLILNFLSPVEDNKHNLSHQEKRLLGEIEDQVRQILTWIFKNYKSLDESSPTGVLDDPKAAIRLPPPALLPAVELYCLLHDILSPETQRKFCQYFEAAAKNQSTTLQAAAKNQSTTLQAETDEFINNNGASISCYGEMVSLFSSFKEEIRIDREIHKQINILLSFGSFINLPKLSASIYSRDLCSRLRAFLEKCPPRDPSSPVIDLVIAAADFQRQLSDWNINPADKGVNAKVLFHSYLDSWIKKEHLPLLDKRCGIKTQQMTAPFINKTYEQLMETLNKYKGIISLWPEYGINLENATADVEEAISKALQKQHADVLAPLDSPAPSMFGKYVQIVTEGTDDAYIVREELGVPLKCMKILVEQHSKIESWFEQRRSYTPPSGTPIPGERLSKIRGMLNENFRKYTQAIGDKIAKKTKDRSEKILKKVIKDSNKNDIESEVRSQMQPLETVLKGTIENLHSVFDPRVFISVCRSLWDGMGQVVLHFLEKRKEKTSGYKGLTIAISILDEIFKSQMQKLLVGALKEKDLDPPESVMEVHSQLAQKS